MPLFAGTGKGASGALAVRIPAEALTSAQERVNSNLFGWFANKGRDMPGTQIVRHINQARTLPP